MKPIHVYTYAYTLLSSISSPAARRMLQRYEYNQSNTFIQYPASHPDIMIYNIISYMLSVLVTFRCPAIV